MADADVLVMVGTSLIVYPAAGFVFEPRDHARTIVANPEIPDQVAGVGCEAVAKPASAGVPEALSELLAAA